MILDERHMFITDPVRATMYLPVLADFLEKLAAWKPEKIDMRRWANAPRPGIDEGSCSTVACAAGWGAYLFAKDGFRITSTASIWSGTYLAPVYRGAYGFAACQKFFGISESASDYLFSPTEYSGHATAMKAVRRIRAFLRDASINEDATAVEQQAT